MFNQSHYKSSHQRFPWQVTYNFYGSVDQKIVFADVDKFIRSGPTTFCRRGLTDLNRWRVGLMEKGIALIDFEKIDSMVQVHGR
jgi:hypothetical protein